MHWTCGKFPYKVYKHSTYILHVYIHCEGLYINSRKKKVFVVSFHSLFKDDSARARIREKRRLQAIRIYMNKNAKLYLNKTIVDIFVYIWWRCCYRRDVRANVRFRQSILKNGFSMKICFFINVSEAMPAS